jgi:protein TonB
MKAKKIAIKLGIFSTVMLLAIICLLGLSSCAAKAKQLAQKTEVPPPPPPPQATPATQIEDEPFVVVEEMPQFPGGDVELLKYVSTNVKYPEVARTNGIQGRVIARFCVTKTGAVNRVSILRGVSPEIDSEALRVVSSLPTFSPGKQGGKAVDVWYMVPITFKLAKKQESEVKQE